MLSHCQLVEMQVPYTLPEVHVNSFDEHVVGAGGNGGGGGGVGGDGGDGDTGEPDMESVIHW